MAVHVIFRLELTELTDGWRLVVDAGDIGQCEVTAPGLHQVLECAVPFMAGVALPDTPESLSEVARLERLFRSASAADGPPDLGGGS